jgi:hypothetical protein
MKRRNFLKAICASPLALLAKKPKRPEISSTRSGTRKLTKAEICNMAQKQFGANELVFGDEPDVTWTMGTSSSDAIWSTWEYDSPNWRAITYVS